MDKLKGTFLLLKKPSRALLTVVILFSVLLAALTYRFVLASPAQVSTASAATPAPSMPTQMSSSTSQPKVHPTATETSLILPTENVTQIAGVDNEDPRGSYPGVKWFRIGYPTCGSGKLEGSALQALIQKYHKAGIRVLLTVCQQQGNALYDTHTFTDAAESNSDAVQCGNEEMKQDASVSFLYTAPDRFAKFYDMCETAVHKVRSSIPVLLGSLDPHVAADDYQLMVNQVNYLDQMQDAMNTTVHPGGNWDWHTQTLGLINSWHDGYDGANNLADLFSFWGQQFNVDPASGQLGKHLWVVEGTACFKGCGVPDDTYDLAVAHILNLITDVQTAQQDRVPFFYFSGKDFQDQGVFWPIGVENAKGQPKPLRQDLSMGARSLTMTCANNKKVTVVDQVQLLTRLYAQCSLPSDYLALLTS